MIRLVATCMVLIFTATALAGDESDARGFPDVSEPKAAAFSLSVALAIGDKEAANSIYAGDDESFAALVEALAAVNASADKLASAATNRFGKNAETLAVYVRDTLPKLDVTRTGRKAPLSSIIAAAEVEQRGNEAVLNLGHAWSIRLERRGKAWKVTEWPTMPELVALSRACTPVYSQIAERIDRGEYRKAYEVWPALAAALSKKTAE